ncbi:signal transduction histidine kinase [Leptolyngbya sp. Heron Island J]|uniref:hybrid sensor histidine kinase/response regulator n=1 Tax=Leptolyngbya sp. Heron Island J TaxID=1385935 RepID=UPI0003B9F1F2|nr:hybrid sensor histidine kinase/response regulator [Leptolyngbya sp. Heron Island J]ESA32816.1 signal transduction histidine kinase [Leptolyngbya sp. Heron Island J]
MDTDQQVRQRFLEESGEYFEQMEQVLLGLPTAQNPAQQLDIAMRAAHSLKGGAGMMGFTPMAQVAHHLEDSLKILRARKLAIDTALETLLLQGVDCLKLVQQQLSAGLITDKNWMAVHVEPVIAQLHLKLGDLSEADEDRLLSEEEDIDIAIVVFNGALEESLNTFETTLELYQDETLRQALCDQAAHLSDLGLMGNIEAFVSLCQSIHSQTESAAYEQLPALRDQAMAAWRRSQSLVQLGRLDRIPLQFEFVPVSITAPLNASDPDLESLADLINLEHLQTAFDQIENPILDSDLPNELLIMEQVSPISSPEEQVVEPTETIAPSPELLESQSRVLQPIHNPRPSNTLRVSADDLQQINDLFGTLILERNSINLRQQQLENFVALLQQRMDVLESFNGRLRQWYDRASMENLLLIDGLKPGRLVTASTVSAENRFNRIIQEQGISQNQSFDALEMDQYSELHLMAQEQMETIVKLQEVTADVRLGLQEMGQSTQALNVTTRQLRKRITRTQMRPFSDIVGHFPRVLRDLAVQYGKKVRLKLEGETTLFERVALDLLADPLNHILRNAFDHGIETEAERLKVGKSPDGMITIQAAQLGSQARIIIHDDGRGIDIDKICDRMHQHGVSADQIARMSKQQLLYTIFDAGFTTATQVTELSGRGVGMNVVRTNLDTLSGTIHVDTQPGAGTTFTIDLPISLSVLRIMLFEHQEMIFAIPVDAVEELIALSPDIIIESETGQQLSWQGKLIPLTSLEAHLKINSNIAFTPLEGFPIINHPMVLVISDNQRYYAVTIQRFWGEQEVATRPVISPIPLPQGFVGTTILGDGRVVPLIELSQLITNSPANMELSTDKIAIAAAEELTSQQTILVVDDSVHSRRFLTITLEKAGYSVEQARDGQEAIDKLLGGLPVKAVLCDVEMPRLDGYDVLDEIKRRPEYKNLPISMLTSRSSDKHRKLAMNLGASAYFTKPYNEQELLRTLANLIEA